MVDVVIVQQRMNDIASPLIISLFKDCSCLHHFGGELSECSLQVYITIWLQHQSILFVPLCK